LILRFRGKNRAQVLYNSFEAKIPGLHISLHAQPAEDRVFAMRLLAIAVGCLATLFLSLASIHFYGLGRKYVPFEHRFLASKTPWIVTGWEQSFFLEKNPDLILLAQVYRASNGSYLIAPSREKMMKGSEREQEPSPSRPLLSDFLLRFPTQRLVLKIVDNVEDIDLQLDKILSKESRTERILVHSDFNLVLESLKKLQPLQLYGSTPADTMRFKSFLSMHILSAVPFKGDVYFVPLQFKKRETINDKIRTELTRRHKKLILGPLETAEEIRLALSLGTDGVYVENPELALQLLSQPKH
jgi:hypothetical protein